ncbi:MAG: hypothetical protein CMJ54_01615 [Planctomycetaceae bacterium]|nr:hypothetical protein [Planctomycetaceae bacterium]
MIRTLFLALVATAVTSAAQAHFLFVHVLPGDESRVEVHFAETGWDFSADDRMVSLISNVRVWHPGTGDRNTTRAGHAMIATHPEGGGPVCGAFTYGLMRRGDVFLLEYHSKGVAGLEEAVRVGGLDAEILATERDGRLVLTVLFRGEPAAGAEIVVPTDRFGVETLATDQNGEIEIPMPKTPLYSIRAMVSEPRTGEHEGEAYEEVRHYTTLTVHPATDDRRRGGDALAAAILEDAIACGDPGFPTDGGWRGRVQGRFGGEALRGSVASSGDGLVLSFPKSTPVSITNRLEVIEGLDDFMQIPASSAVLVPGRGARSDLRIRMPESNTMLRIRDRRIVSMTSPTDSGSRRVDVLDWETVDDGRHLPTRVLVTSFDQDGAIASTAIVTTTFAVEDGVRVPGSHAGTVIGNGGDAEAFSLQVSDVRISGS